jgi:hypothetical protein
VSSGTATFATTAAGAPTSYSEISAVESNEEPGQEPYDVPGSYAEYRTGPVTISTSPSAPGVLRLPVAGTGSYGPVVYAHAPGTSVTRGCPQAPACSSPARPAGSAQRRCGDGAAPGRHRLGRPGGRPPSAGR